ncbi:unnamed protein product, partial [Discosporangium mesarthrocarpum]
VELIRPKRLKLTVSITTDGGGGAGFGGPVFSELKQVDVRNRMKLLQFREDYRPPYWGTWSKDSREVTGRSPFARDTQGILNYCYDSEGEREPWGTKGL